MMATDNGPVRELIQWNWLVMSESRSEYYCPPGYQLTSREFGNALGIALLNNGLPASAKLVDVNWDASGTVQRRALVTYTGTEQTGDILQTFVGVDQVGRFVYVETKNCIRQPDLPKVPRERKNTSLGVSSADDEGLFGCVAILFTAVFSLFAWLYYLADGRYEWNREADAEQQAWNAAWDQWADKRLRLAYLKRRDDILGRYNAAVASTVNQVAKTLLIDRDAELRKQTEEQRKLEEIEQEMAKRRQQSMA